MELTKAAQTNAEALKANVYPGRGLVIGLTPDARRYVQVYWIMGRSENSRNRVFVREGDLVRTAPFDPTKVQDPSLIIYNCARQFARCHIVSNGDQTDTVFDVMQRGGSFEEALFTRSAEPDAPNFTARITGVLNLDDPRHAYKLSVIKVIGHDQKRGAWHFFSYGSAVPGIGHCIHTYAGDGKPLPCFEGEPYVVPILADAAVTAARYWETLNAENKVSLFAKTIDMRTGATDIATINKLRP